MTLAEQAISDWKALKITRPFMAVAQREYHAACYRVSGKIIWTFDDGPRVIVRGPRDWASNKGVLGNWLSRNPNSTRPSRRVFF